MAYAQRDYVFTKGKTTIGEFLEDLSAGLVSAGWNEVSSDRENDGYVWKSVGNEGDKNLIINVLQAGQFKKPAPENYYMYLYLPRGYTPGEPGTEGEFERRGSYSSLSFYPTSYPVDTIIEYYRYIDANGFIYFIQPPDKVNNFWMYCRLTDNRFAEDSGNRGMFKVGSNYSSSAAIADSPDGFEPASDIYALTQYILKPPGNVSADGTRFFCEIYYGNVTENMRLKMDGIYGLHHLGAQVYQVGDTFIQDNKTYMVITGYYVARYSPGEFTYWVIRTA